MHSIKVPKAKNGRVVVLRDKAFGGIFDTGWQAQLDGAPLGDLKTGTFVYRDLPAGPTSSRLHGQKICLANRTTSS